MSVVVVHTLESACSNAAPSPVRSRRMAMHEERKEKDGLAWKKYCSCSIVQQYQQFNSKRCMSRGRRKTTWPGEKLSSLMVQLSTVSTLSLSTVSTLSTISSNRCMRKGGACPGEKIGSHNSGTGAVGNK